MMPATRTQITPEAAHRERARRKLSRQVFLHFCTYVDPKYQTPAHIRLVAEKLQQVERFMRTQGREGISRLMIEMPPQNGKSEMVSRKFPAWILGRMPDTHIILASYGADLASKHSRAVRDLVETQQYQALFGGLSSTNEPVELSSDSRSVAVWDLARPHRGGMMATGVGGGITGNPADLLILDDLFKNRDEAESDNRREFVDDWYKSSASTRLSPFAAVIIFFTRWHQDDQAGRLLKRMIEEPGADQWDCLSLPAIAEEDCYVANEEEQRAKLLEGIYMPITDPLGRKIGQALWPERFGIDWLLTKRANIGSYEFSALYQQMPFLRSGEYFKRSWFKVIPKVPEGVTLLYIVRYWDKAASAMGDFTAGVLMGYGSDGIFYILDVTRGQWTPYLRDKRMRETAEADAATWGNVKIWHQQDPGSAGIDSAQATNRVLLGYPAKYETMTGEKTRRADPLSSACQGDLVRLLQGAWNAAFIDECAAFDRGRYDDQVDAGSSAYNKLLEMIRKATKQVTSYQG